LSQENLKSWRHFVNMRPSKDTDDARCQNSFKALSPLLQVSGRCSHPVSVPPCRMSSDIVR